MPVALVQRSIGYDGTRAGRDRVTGLFLLLEKEKKLVKIILNVIIFKLKIM